MQAVDANSGDERWRTPTTGIVWASPAVDDARVYVGEGDGTFYALDTVAPTAADTVLFRRYLNAGGTVVTFGAPPLIAPLNLQSLLGLNREAAPKLIGCAIRARISIHLAPHLPR